MYKSLFIIGLVALSTTVLAGRRIIGGTNARSDQYPFAAAIYIHKSNGIYFCSGSLISNQWLITTGNCVTNATLLTIQLGSVNLKASDSNRLIVATDNIVFHPDFVPNEYHSDIALVKFRLPIQLSEYIQPIALPVRDLPGFAVLSAIGWGQINDATPGPVETLQTVTLTSLSNDECKLTYGEQITENMVCVEGNFNEGTCINDIGGALIQLVNGNRATHAGVASFVSGRGCESTDPSGFIRTYPHINWIKDVTGIE